MVDLMRPTFRRRDEQRILAARRRI